MRSRLRIVWGVRPLRALVTAAIAALLPAAVAAEGFEAPHPIPVADAVPEPLRAGEGFQVADPVYADGYAERFTVKSDRFGSFEADCEYMLPFRVQEVRALGALAQIDSSEAFTDAVVASVKAPFEVAKDLVTEPGETLEGAGEGAKKAFNKAKGWLGGDRRDRADTEDSAFTEALGVSRRKRKLAGALGVNPYSSNQKLQDELDRVAWWSASGGMSFGALMMALPIPPGIDLARQAVGATGGLNNLLVTKSGGDLYKMNREILRSLEIPASESEPYLDNPKASPRHKTFTVAAIKEMQGVEGLDAFVHRGRRVANEEEALRLQRIAELGAGYHKKVAPLQKVVLSGDELAFVAVSGELVAMLPADRLLWTQASADRAASLSQMAADANAGEKQVWISGVVSDRARDGLRDLDFDVHAATKDQLAP